MERMMKRLIFSKMSVRSGLQVKLGLVLIVSTTVILSAFTSYDYLNTKREISRELNASADRMADRLAIGLETPLWELNEGHVGRFIDSEMVQKTIYAVLVRDAKGEAISYGKKRNESWQPVVTLDPQGFCFTGRDFFA
jgi:hypothetical protein